MALLIGGQGASAASGTSPYFPSAFDLTRLTCARDRETAARLWRFQSGWFSRHLAAAREPSLYQRSIGAPSAGGAALRFLWLRSFEPPVVVRIEWRSDGSARLIAKQLTGEGGYAPGTIGKMIEHELDAQGAANIKASITRDHLFSPARPNCGSIEPDGGVWIFEAVDRDGYHFTQRQSPDDGAIRRMGERLLDLTGWRFDRPE